MATKKVRFPNISRIADSLEKVVEGFEKTINTLEDIKNILNLIKLRLDSQRDKSEV